MAGKKFSSFEIMVAKQMRARGCGLNEIADRLGRARDTIRIHLGEKHTYKGVMPHFPTSVQAGSEITLSGDFTPEQIAAYRDRFGHNRVAVCRDSTRGASLAPRWSVASGDMVQIGGAP